MKTRDYYFLGIKPGPTGALAMLDAKGDVVLTIKMDEPHKSIEDKKYRDKRAHINAIADAILERYGDRRPHSLIALIEKQTFLSTSQQKLRIMRDMAMWEGWCQANGFEEVLLRHPLAWQEAYKSMPAWQRHTQALRDAPSHQKKWVYGEIIKEIFGEDVFRQHCTSKLTKFFDGIYDALLLAKWLHIRHRDQLCS